MSTKTITLNDLNISFFDNEEDADATLLFIHGNSLNANLFQNQLNDPVLNQYRLIAPNLPGHGASANSEFPQKDYSVLSYIETLKSLVEELNLKNIFLIGHSLGGHIAIHLLPLLQEAGINISGMAIMGSPPLTLPPKIEEAFLPNPVMGLAFKPDLSADEIEMLANTFIDSHSPYFDMVKESISTTDSMVRPLIGKSIATEISESEVEILRNSDVPLAVLHGENDSLVNLEYIKKQGLALWDDRVHNIEHSGHMPFLEQSSQFNSIIFRFLGKVYPE